MTAGAERSRARTTTTTAAGGFRHAGRAFLSVSLIAGLLLGCGRDAGEPRAPDVPETAAGRTSFERYCSACHDPDGRGGADGAPPLVGSPWVEGPAARLIRIVLHGLRGPVEVGGRTYNLEMPGFGQILTDAEVAAVLSFIRARFGGDKSPIAPAAVRRVRAETRSRSRYWTAEELLAIE